MDETREASSVVRPTAASTSNRDVSNRLAGISEARKNGEHELADHLITGLTRWYERRIDRAVKSGNDTKAARLRAELEACPSRKHHVSPSEMQIDGAVAPASNDVSGPDTAVVVGSAGCPAAAELPPAFIPAIAASSAEVHSDVSHGELVRGMLDGPPPALTPLPCTPDSSNNELVASHAMLNDPAPTSTPLPRTVDGSDKTARPSLPKENGSRDTAPTASSAQRHGPTSIITPKVSEPDSSAAHDRTRGSHEVTDDANANDDSDDAEPDQDDENDSDDGPCPERQVTRHDVKSLLSSHVGNVLRANRNNAMMGHDEWVETARFGDVVSFVGDRTPRPSNARPSAFSSSKRTSIGALARNESCYLHGDAASCQVGATDSNNDWAACLWRIVPALQYEHLEEHCRNSRHCALDRFTSHTSVVSLLETLQVSSGYESINASTRPTPEQQLAVLAIQHEVKENTERLAATILHASARAKELSYGDVVQLQHVRSGLFLCVQNANADLDHTSAKRLTLHVGCKGCYLSVMPCDFVPTRSFLDPSGRRPISYNDELCLATASLAEKHSSENGRSPELLSRSSPFVLYRKLPISSSKDARASKDEGSAATTSATAGIALSRETRTFMSPPGTNIYELGAYPDRAISWTLTAYARTQPNEVDIFYNQPFFLFSKCGEGFITTACAGASDDLNSKAEQQRDIVNTLLASSCRSPQSRQVSPTDESIGRESHMGSHIGPLRVRTSLETVSPNDVKSHSASGIFTLEPTRRVGGEKKIFTQGICFGETVRIRHAMTGKYLKVERKHRKRVHGSDHMACGLALAESKDGESALDTAMAFTLLPRESESTQMGSPIQRSNEARICSVRFGCLVVSPLDAQEKSSTGFAGEVVAKKEATDEEQSFQLVPLSPTEEADFSLVSSLKPWAHTYCRVVADLAERQTNEHVLVQSDEQANLLISSLAKINVVLRRAYFALTIGSSHDIEHDPFIIGDGPPQPSLQSMCRDGGFMDDLMRMVLAPCTNAIPITFDQTTASYSDARFAFLLKNHKLIVKVLTRTFLDNRESETYFASNIIPIGPQELLASLMTTSTSASGETSQDECDGGFLDSIVHIGEGQDTCISYIDVFLLQMGEKLFAEDLLASLLTFNEGLLSDATVVNRTLVERIFDLILLLKGPRAEFLRILAALCACGAPGSRKKVLGNQELLTQMLMLDDTTASRLPENGNAAKLREDLIFLRLTASEAKDKENDRLPREVYASWNCDKEYKIGNADEASRAVLFYEPYSPRLFFRDGLKELPHSQGNSAPQPGIEVWSLSDQLQPMKFVSTAHGEKGWKKFSDLPEEERCQPGILRHRYEVEHDAPTGSSVQAANPQKSDALSAGHREQQAFRPRVKMAEEWTENQAQIARYFLEQLRVLSFLCFDRSANAIVQLQSRYDYTVLLAIIKDGRVAPSVRTSASDLLDNLYLTRWPHYSSCGRCEMPFLVWVYEAATARKLVAPGECDIFPRFMQCCPLVDDHFEDLKRQVFSYLAKESSISFYASEQNALTFKLLDIMSKLFSFGFCSRFSEVKELCISMVGVLNPTLDSPRNARESSPQTEHATLAKMRAVTVLSQVHRTLTHWRIENFLASLKYLIGDKVFETTHNATGSFEAALGVALGGAVFGARAAQRLRADVDSLFGGADAEAFENQVLCGYVLNRSLLELLMFEDDRLFESTLDLLLSRFRSYSGFGFSLSRITVLSTEELPVFENYQTLQFFIANLRIAIETAEIWATESEFSEASETDCSTVNNALYWLEVFIYFDSEEDAKEASPTRCPIKRIRGVSDDAAEDPVVMEVHTGTPPSWLPDWYLDRQPRPAYDEPLKPRALHQSICHGLGLVDILIEALKVGQSLLKMPNPPVSNDAATRGQRRLAPREKSLDAALPPTEQPAPSPRSPRSPRSRKGSIGSFASQAASRISAALGGGKPSDAESNLGGGAQKLEASVNQNQSVEEGKRTNAERIKRLLDAVIHCLFALVDKHPMTKRAVLAQVHEVIECVRIGRATSPRKLVNLCKLIFSGEPELCQNISRELLRLLCSYVHTAMSRLDKEPSRGDEATELGDHADWRQTEPDGDLLQEMTMGDTADFLHETLELIFVIVGGEDEAPHRAVQRFIEQALLSESDDARANHFRRLATSKIRANSKCVDPFEATRVQLIKLFEIICRERDAPKVRRVLPLTYFAGEFATQQNGGSSESTQCARKTLEQLLYSAFFVVHDREVVLSTAGANPHAVSELVLFAERLRPLLHRERPPAAGAEMTRLQSTLLVLYAFSEAAKERATSHSADAVQQEGRIGQVAIEAYISLQRWTQNANSSDGRALRSATGLSGRIARTLAPDELERKLHSDKGNATAQFTGEGAASKSTSKARTKEHAPVATAVETEASHSGTERPAIDFILAALKADPLIRLRAEAEDESLVRFIRGTFGIAYGDHSNDDTASTSNLPQSSSSKFGLHMRREAQRIVQVQPEAAEMNAPAHPGFDRLLKRFVVYCRRRMKDRSAVVTRTKTEIIKLLTAHIELVKRSDPDNHEGGDTRQHEINYLLDPFAARAKTFLRHLNGDSMTSFILLLVFLGIAYDIIVVVILELQSTTMDYIMIIVMWIFFAEVSAKLGAHIAAFGTLRRFYLDPFCMLDLTLVAMDLVMFYGIEGKSNIANNSRMLRLVKLFKGARALRIVGRAVKIYQAQLAKREMDEELQKQAEAMGNEVATMMQLLTENGVGELLYTMIDTAGDGADEADLAEHSYNLAMLLLSMPHNKDIYESLQGCGKSREGSGKQFFADRIVWDTAVFAVNGAAQAHAKQTSIEKYERANTEANAIQFAIERVKKQRGDNLSDDALIDEAEELKGKLTLPGLAEAWLDGLVQKHTAADQQLIAEAIDEASRQGVPETSLAVTSAKTALLELRYGRLRTVVAAASAMLSAIVADGVGRIFDQATDALNFMSTVLPAEPNMLRFGEWTKESPRIESKLLLAGLFFDGLILIGVGTFVAYLMWNISHPERVLAKYVDVVAPMVLLQHVFDLYEIVVTLCYAVNPVSIFSVAMSLVTAAVVTVITRRAKSQPRVEDWMLDNDTHFEDASQLEKVLVSIGPSVTESLKEAIDILGEGGLERNSRIELVDSIIAESSRALALAEDLREKLKKSKETVKKAHGQRQPRELKTLLNNAVRMPRVSAQEQRRNEKKKPIAKKRLTKGLRLRLVTPTTTPK